MVISTHLKEVKASKTTQNDAVSTKDILKGHFTEFAVSSSFEVTDEDSWVSL